MPNSGRTTPAAFHTVEGELRSATKFLADAGIDSPRVDAEMIMAAVLGVSREKLITIGREPFKDADRLRFNRWVSRRGDRREPLAYVIGWWDFYGQQFRVSPSTLVPRPETEVLVERALKVIGKRRLRVADIGTGCGAIAVSIASHSPARVTATDISARALEVAKSNAKEGKVEFILGNLLAPLKGRRFDLVVSNPPYVSSGQIFELSPEVQREPLVALDGGPDGLDVVRKLAAGLAKILAPGGRVLVEIGAGQAAEAAKLFNRAGFRGVTFVKDLASIDRVLEAVLPRRKNAPRKRLAGRRRAARPRRAKGR